MTTIPLTSEIHALADGRKLGYAIYGSSDSTRTVLYMHGVPGTRLEGANWHKWAVEAGVRLICPERPGIGLSSSAPSHSLFDFAADCCHLLQSLQVQEVSVLGYSGGSAAALVCAQYIAAHRTASPSPLRLRATGIVAGMAPYATARPYLSLPQKVIVNLAWYAPAVAARLVDWGIGQKARDAQTGDETAQKVFSQTIERSLLGLDEHSKAIFETQPEYKAMLVRNLQEAYSGEGGTRAVLHDVSLLIQDWGVDFAKPPSPLTLWYGEQDANVRCEMGRDFVKLLKVDSKEVKYNELEEQTHFTIIPEKGGEILAALLS